MCEEKRENMEQIAKYRNKLRKQPLLLYLFFELTDQCNMNCRHCGSNCSAHGNQVLPYDDIVKVLRQVKDSYGTASVMICLTGGEPLLHPEFEKIIQCITEFGFRWGITTNGTLINESLVRHFKECRLKSVTLSLDGTEEVNDWFRQKQGAYKMILNAIRLLHENGILVQVTTVVHKKNIHELDCLFQIMEKNDVESWKLINIEPIGRAIDIAELMLDKEDYLYLLDFVRDKRFSRECKMEVTYACSHFLGLKYEHNVRGNYFICGSGIYVASILCNGDIFSCLDIERNPKLIQGNIYEDNFIDVWENRFQVFRQDRTELCNECMDCRNREICGGDSTHTWNFYENRPNLCLSKILEKKEK